MKDRKNYSLRKRIKYILDDFVSKGFWAQVLLLVGTGLLLTLLFGIVAVWLGQPDYDDGYWVSLMHMIDQGTITGDREESDAFLSFMLIVTFIGMAFTSTTIALINNAIQGKLDELKKGHSGVIECNHVVVLGFDENAYTICREIVEGKRVNGEKVCLVVADDLPKEEMEHSTKEFLGGTRQYFEKSASEKRKDKKIKLIFRSGDLISENTFSICSVENAKAIVINRENDLETVRILLSLVAYLKKNHAYMEDREMPSIVALVHERSNLTAAKVAAGLSFEKNDEKRKNEYKVRIMYSKETLARLFAQSCLHQGLPFVMDGLFNYRGASIHIEDDGAFGESRKEHPFLEKSLPEITAMVSGAIPIGFIRSDSGTAVKVILNPSGEMRYGEEDRLIYLSETAKLVREEREPVEPVGVSMEKTEREKKKHRSFLIIGWSEALSGMLENVCNSSAEGSMVSLISKEQVAEPAMAGGMKLNSFVQQEDPYNWEKTGKVFEENRFWFDSENPEKLTNIVILSPSGMEKNEADEKVMVLLLNIRRYLKDKAITDISITSEMNLPKNQMLVQNNASNDFVVATEISNRMMAQIAEDPRKYYIVEDLLKQKSGEIELHPVSDYIDVTKEFNFEFVFRVVCERAKSSGETEIPLGWIKVGAEDPGQDDDQAGPPRLVLNPTKEEREQLYIGNRSFSNYRLIILADGVQSKQ